MITFIQIVFVDVYVKRAQKEATSKHMGLQSEVVVHCKVELYIYINMFFGKVVHTGVIKLTIFGGSNNPNAR